jgi:hypothetical protein
MVDPRSRLQEDPVSKYSGDMTTWTERPDGWHSDGLHIVLAAPFKWLLFDNERPDTPVGIPEQPLAVARSLTECKREAELVLARRQRAEIRRRHAVILLLVIAGSLLMLGPSWNVNAFIVLIALGLSSRSIGILVGTVLPSAFRERHQIFYQ